MGANHKSLRWQVYWRLSWNNFAVFTNNLLGNLLQDVLLSFELYNFLRLCHGQTMLMIFALLISYDARGPWNHTVWKFAKFFASQIFREIIFSKIQSQEQFKNDYHFKNLNQLKLISRKIWMAEIFLNFHTVNVATFFT